MIAVVVESPALARTLGGILGSGAVVRATFGKVADLAPGARADIGGPPLEKLLPGKAHLVSELRRLSRGARILLATDPDREGEAAAFVLARAIGPAALEPGCRVVFRSLRAEDVTAALERAVAPRRGAWHASLLRRLADGRIAGALSAAAPGSRVGRVQAAALRILAGPARPGFEVEVVFEGRLRARAAAAPLARDQAEALVARLRGARARVLEVREEERVVEAPPPFTTATLLAEAAARGIGSGAAARILDRLYQGVDVDGIATGLLSYPRTGDRGLPAELAAQAHALALDQGDGALAPRFAGCDSAHGAIVPVDLALDPAALAGLGRDERRILHLVRERVLDSQRGSRRVRVRIVHLEAAGVPMVAEQGADEPAPVGERSVRRAILAPVGGEAALVAELAVSGVGRPGTLGQVVASLRERGLVSGSVRSLGLTGKGEELAAALFARAPDLCDPALTAGLEEALDAVEAGDPPWPDALRAVFARTYMAAGRQVGKQRPLPPDLGEILAGFDRSVP